MLSDSNSSFVLLFILCIIVISAISLLSMLFANMYRKDQVKTLIAFSLGSQVTCQLIGVILNYVRLNATDFANHPAALFGNIVYASWAFGSLSTFAIGLALYARKELIKTNSHPVNSEYIDDDNSDDY